MNLLKKTFQSLKNNPDLLGRIFSTLAVIVILAVAIYLSGTKPEIDSGPLPTPTIASALDAAEPVVNSTPVNGLFSEFASTTGVVITTLGVVFILLMGTFIELLSSRKKQD